MVVTGIDRALTVQRPAVLAHIRSIRSAHPNATPAQVITILERRYLTAVTTGGAAVGASAVVPGVGMAASLALSAVETAGFLEASALFAQSVTEIHGIAVQEPDRARTLVMTLVLGSAGSDLVKQFAGQAAGVGPARNAFWGEMVTKNLPKAAVGRIADQMKRTFAKRFAARQGASVLGRAIPFGIGAVVGGSGNLVLGRQVVKGTQEAFGPAPLDFPEELAPRIRIPRGRRFSLRPWRSGPHPSESTMPSEEPLKELESADASVTTSERAADRPDWLPPTSTDRTVDAPPPTD
jgi:hypothetical protein